MSSLPKRIRGGRSANDYHIVVAYDGRVTEDGYFRNWANILGTGTLTLYPLYVKSGGNPLSAVREANKYRRRYANCAEFWCVCDVDDTSEADIAAAHDLAESSNIRLALSRRCFEVWIALHWDRITKEINCENDAIDIVRENISSYSSRNKSIDFGTLFPLTSQAISNAHWLSEQSLSNPSTNVHVLVRKLNSNL
ncbi:RloB-like protein [Sphingomonas sp. YR710]|uniref:RloB family protein n=1 Tax=Sphingomonas sp. YR710 TaxID=1882773 RepID=UPI00088D6B9C|nr:RloB family protein [Sphingomonas sp. YR710]SDB98056.1 RloB-like protein [Sphingomonas sp. YR710]